MKTSTNINEIANAISKLQSEMKGAEKGSVNPFFKSKYSSLEDAWACIREHLGKNGLSVIQELITKEQNVSVTTLIAHSSGQWIELGPLDVPFAKRDAQSVGSACSYAKRYSLCAALGIVSSTEDDDGNKAVHDQKTEETNHIHTTINETQFQNLEVMLESEDEEYKKNILGYINNAFGSQSLKYLPANKYDVIYEAIMKRKNSRVKNA